MQQENIPACSDERAQDGISIQPGREFLFTLCLELGASNLFDIAPWECRRRNRSCFFIYHAKRACSRSFNMDFGKRADANGAVLIFGLDLGGL